MKFASLKGPFKYYSFSDTSSSRYLETLYSQEASVVSESLFFLKNVCVGSKKGKESGKKLLPRILEILQHYDDDVIVYTCLVIINSISKEFGDEVVSLGALDKVIAILNKASDPRLTSMVLTTLKTLSSHIDLSEYSNELSSFITSTKQQDQENVCLILSNMESSSIVTSVDYSVILNLLQSSNTALQIACLRLLLKLEHPSPAMLMTLPDILTALMSQESCLEMQLLSCSLMANLLSHDLICPEDTRVLHPRLVSALIRCIQSKEYRSTACQVLSLILNERLNDTLAFTVFPSITEFLKESPKSAFVVFAALASSDVIRKKILEVDGLIYSIAQSLSRQQDNPELCLEALKCLHSLSRSIQSTDLINPLIKSILMNNDNTEMLLLASSTLCNILPNLDNYEDNNEFIAVLKNLTGKERPLPLRVNGITALMNMLYKTTCLQVKLSILEQLGVERIKELLEDDEAVGTKTLGFLRNLFNNRSHVDHIMTQSEFSSVMECLVAIISNEDSSEQMREEALCVIANISDGDHSRHLVLNNSVILDNIRLIFLENSSNNLCLAATLIVSNLVWSDEEGDRQSKLRSVGVYDALKSLLNTADTQLFDKVKSTMEHFHR